MKFLCVVLVVSSLIAIGSALVAPWEQPATVTSDSICLLDSDCPGHCFCYKHTDRQQRGQCVCVMDIRVLNECSEDRECTERNSYKNRQSCFCSKINAYQPMGQCECLNPVG